MKTLKTDWQEVIQRWATFNLIGLSGVSIQIVLLTAMVESGVSYLPATAIAVQAAVLNNFVWYERWTWPDRPAGSKSAASRRLLRFCLSVGMLSVAQNLFFMNLLVGHWGLPYVPANLAGIAICSLVNFSVSDRLVFVRAGLPGEGRVAGNLCNT